MSDVSDVRIETGIPGDDQMSGFMNATLQSTSDYKCDFSIATHVEIPSDVEQRGETAVAQHLAKVLAACAGEGLRFHVQVGPFGDGR